MRKILLATSALVAISAAGAAYAAEQQSPVSVNVGGYVDFRAAFFHESKNNNTGSTKVDERNNFDTESEFAFDIAAEGKGAYNTEYGGLITLSNDNNYQSEFGGSSNSVYVKRAYVWLGGKYGKVMLGDEEGASQLFVTAPSVGEGQVFGKYKDFVDPTTLWRTYGSYVDSDETSTKFSYFSPKLGNKDHKVQVGVSYAPRAYDNGQSVQKYKTDGTSTLRSLYKDWVESVARYDGSFGQIDASLTGQVTTATGNASTVYSFEDATLWGLGAQAKWKALTVGGSYTDGGDFGKARDGKQNKDQNIWTLGARYDFAKLSVSANYLGGEGYNNLFNVQGDVAEARSQNYVKSFDSYGLGGVYTWFPGLTTSLEGVFFKQERSDKDAGKAIGDNTGNVIMLSQKITF